MGSSAGGTGSGSGREVLGLVVGKRVTTGKGLPGEGCKSPSPLQRVMKTGQIPGGLGQIRAWECSASLCHSPTGNETQQHPASQTFH